MVNCCALRNQRGNVLLTTLVVISAVVMGVFIYLDSFRSTMTQKRKLETLDSIQVMQDSIMSALQNDDSWRQTVLKDGLGCLATDGAVCVPPPGDRYLTVYLADGITRLANGNPADPNGFDAFGSACSTYPSDDCPFKFVITWKPVCGGACPATLLSTLTQTPIQPDSNFTINLVYAGSNENLKVVNCKDRFKRDFTRATMEGSLSSTCRNSGGDFNPVTKKCQFQVRGCPGNELPIGFDKDGRAHCRENKFLSRSCGPTFAFIGITPGGPLCSKF